MKVLEPKPYGGKRMPKMLKNFIFDMGQYFMALGIDLEEFKMNKVTMFLQIALRFSGGQKEIQEET